VKPLLLGEKVGPAPVRVREDEGSHLFLLANNFVVGEEEADFFGSGFRRVGAVH